MEEAREEELKVGDRRVVYIESIEPYRYWWSERRDCSCVHFGDPSPGCSDFVYHGRGNEGVVHTGVIALELAYKEPRQKNGYRIWKIDGSTDVPPSSDDPGD